MAATRQDPPELALEEESKLRELLSDLDQGHLLEDLDEPGQRRLLTHVRHIDGAYSGGLSAYVQNARRLLLASKRGDNPFEGCTPHVPTGEKVIFGDARHVELEDRGRSEVRQAAFVLVAGGLGERLGFSGIKLALPASVVAGWCYLEYYCQCILAFQQPTIFSEQEAIIPLVIMTSGDTHAKTMELLVKNNYFGLQPEQVHVLMQEMVPCLSDTEAHLSRDPQDPSQIETKPHGHGDVHALLHTSGLAQQFLDEGRQWLFFFQDTNHLVFKVALSTLGKSAEAGFAMNSISVPRKPKDASGGIMRLERADGSNVTINVEYNQLDPLLRNTINPEGDAADETGFSPFPGNMNVLITSLSTYVETLKRTSGIIAEFVNPKYADSSKTKFKSSTRLECMMQDFPLELPPEATVGFTQYDLWCAYSPVKNSPASAKQKWDQGNHPQCGTTGEADLFTANCRILRMAGVQVGAPTKARFNGIEVELEARVVLSPSWATRLRDVRGHLLPDADVRISQRSSLFLEGAIDLQCLHLDGALVIKASPGARVVIKHLVVSNAGWTLEPISEDCADEVARIRGFTVRRNECRELIFDSPGEYVIEEA